MHAVAGSGNYHQYDPPCASQTTSSRLLGGAKVLKRVKPLRTMNSGHLLAQAATTAHPSSSLQITKRVPLNLNPDTRKSLTAEDDSNLVFKAFSTCNGIVSDASQKVLRHLLKRSFVVKVNSPEFSEAAVFDGIDQREYKALCNLVQKNDNIIKKPRLTHNAQRWIVIIEWPSAVHEAPFNNLKDVMTLAVNQIPYDRNLLTPMLQMNFTMESDNFSGTPDMVLSLTRLVGIPTVHIPFIGECAFSQQQSVLELKLKNEIETHPEVIMIVMVVVKEVDTYHAPQHGSAAWQAFCGHTTSQSLQYFLEDPQGQSNPPGQIPGTKCSLSQPIMVREHVWCHISTVEYFMWVKKGEEVIDIDKHDQEHMAYGTLFPELSMDAVKEKVSEGFVKIRNYIATLCNIMNPGAEGLEIEATKVSLPLDFGQCLVALEAAAYSTAYEHYQVWFKTNFRGTKHSHSHSPSLSPPSVDSCDTPPASNLDSESPVASRTRSKIRPI